MLMNAKEYLRGLSREEARIKAKKERLSIMQDLARSVSSPSFSDLPKGKGSEHPRLEETIVKMLSLEEEIKRDEDELTERKTEALDYIGKIKEPDYQTVLISRYFRNESWEEISLNMFYSLRWVYSLHGYALEELDRVINEECS